MSAPYSQTSIFECEIRTTNANNSHDGDASGFTVTEDHHHTPYDTEFDDRGQVTVYIEDDHDVAFDVTIRSTAADDGDYTGLVDEQTVSLASGSDTAKVTLTGPIGRLSYRFGDNGSLASAPTAGSCRVVTHAVP